MSRRHRETVSYRTEFLYFNEMVRRTGVTPQSNPEIWQADDDGSISPFGMFSYLLENTLTDNRGKLTGVRDTPRAVRALGLPDVPTSLDFEPWLQYAQSLGIDAMVERYTEVIFEFFRTSFHLPDVRVSPVRLVACRPDFFAKLRDRRYTTHHILHADPPRYWGSRDYVFMPTPEHRMGVPPGLYDEFVAHEFLHAPFNILSPDGFVFEDGLVLVLKKPLDWALGIFGELFACYGSLAVLSRSRALSDDATERVVKNIQFRRAPATCKIAGEAMCEMLEIPFGKWCAVLRPVFGLCRDIARLSAERRSIKDATEKKLAGILRKTYRYKSKVGRKGRDQLQEQAYRRSASRLRALMSRMEEMNLRKLIRSLGVTETSPRRRRALGRLSSLFTEQHRGEWQPLLG